MQTQVIAVLVLILLALTIHGQWKETYIDADDALRRARMAGARQPTPR